jgi:hypothetical protein
MNIKIPNDLTLRDEPVKDTSTFSTAAVEELSALRVAIRGVMSEIDGVSKPADLQRTLKLDQTLSWQLFKIINGANVLSGGSVVPSRTSIDRFLKAVKSRGVDAAKLRKVVKAYDGFEQLVHLHAGDRVTFNSMVSAAAGLDEDWLSTDLQHRRNMFRGLSHAMGLRAKTRLQLTAVSDRPAEHLTDYISITGMVDLRLLRDFPSVRVYGLEMVGRQQTNMIRRPLGGGSEAKGYLLADFSSNPLGSLKMTEYRSETSSWFQASLENPKVGNVGSKTLMFAEAIQNYPYHEGSRGWNVIIARPFEVVLNDMLVMPGSFEGMVPSPEVFWGHPDMEGRAPDVMPVMGDFSVEKLGKGPDALATSDVPNYPAMVRATVAKLGWDIEQAEAWRVRVEYPMYQTSVRIRWSPSKPASTST